MFGLGMGELVVILLIVVVLFGAAKLPQLGDAIGRSIRNFKRASTGGSEIEVSKQKEISVGAAQAELHADVEVSKSRKE
ncbi:MAG: twin-arginine translocase TatA/TatE family subunit [Myxococcales bacterium]|nr:twin-arginine translocase TatA/TatE family subunit [Myxococcales bacterium]